MHGSYSVNKYVITTAEQNKQENENGNSPTVHGIEVLKIQEEDVFARNLSHHTSLFVFAVVC